jgi:hypothetical protein
MLFAGQNNTQIAAPQRATNQASESQASTSSRFMVGPQVMLIAAKCCSDGADALPEQPHPVLLLNANNLRFRAVVKTATGRALNLPRSVLRRNTDKNILGCGDRLGMIDILGLLLDFLAVATAGQACLTTPLLRLAA